MDNVRTGGQGLQIKGGLSENLANDDDDFFYEMVMMIVIVMMIVMVMIMWTTAGKSSKAVVLMVLIRAPATRKTSTNFPTVDAKAVIVIDDLNN